MRPRYSADWRSLVWVLAMPCVVLAQYRDPALAKWLWPLGFYLALAAGILAHNHNHCPTFASKRANAIYGNVLSIFYGYPTFAWIPTHNLNHHKLVNRAGDATITWRHTRNHHAIVAATYFFVSAYWQSDPIKRFIRKARDGNRKLFRQIVTQYVVWGTTHVALFALAVAMHGLRRGLFVWSIAVALPAFFSLWTIMLFNYIQHVHCDPWSAHDHSRNFTGRLTNFLLFNNGLHAAHHEHAGAHWSTLPALHAAIAPEIDPALKLRSFWAFIVRQYLLAPFFPSLGTRQVGRAAWDPPSGEAESTEAADVDAVDAGTNAAIA